MKPTTKLLHPHHFHQHLSHRSVDKADHDSFLNRTSLSYSGNFYSGADSSKDFGKHKLTGVGYETGEEIHYRIKHQGRDNLGVGGGGVPKPRRK